MKSDIGIKSKFPGYSTEISGGESSLKLGVQYIHKIRPKYWMRKIYIFLANGQDIGVQMRTLLYRPCDIIRQGAIHIWRPIFG